MGYSSTFEKRWLQNDGTWRRPSRILDLEHLQQLLQNKENEDFTQILAPTDSPNFLQNEESKRV